MRNTKTIAGIKSVRPVGALAAFAQQVDRYADSVRTWGDDDLIASVEQVDEHLHTDATVYATDIPNGEYGDEVVADSADEKMALLSALTAEILVRVGDEHGQVVLRDAQAQATF